MKTKKNKGKWSKLHKDASIGFWNPWSYCNKRHEYAKSLQYDILGLGELHNRQIEKKYECLKTILETMSIHYLNLMLIIHDLQNPAANFSIMLCCETFSAVACTVTYRYVRV